jgi:DNA repair photolyase
VRPVQVKNPPNRFSSTVVEYFPELGELPEVGLEVYEDHTKSIIAQNTSPDVGFSWSVNPYRGCFHACAYCMGGDTRILMADGRTRTLAELREGDEIYGTERRGSYRRYVRTRVLAHWSVIKPAYRVTLADGTELITSADHRLLTRRGYKFTTGTEHGPAQRPHLTLNDKLLGTGAFASAPADCPDYRTGYLCGLIRGDGLIGTYCYSGRRRQKDVQHQFRLALVGREALERARRYLLDREIGTNELFQRAAGDYQEMLGIRTYAGRSVERIRELVCIPNERSPDWCKGFLAGIFDAEGCYSAGNLRITNTAAELIQTTVDCARRFDWDVTVETNTRGIQNVRFRGGLREHLRFFHTVDPAISRKRGIGGRALKFKTALRVKAIEPLGVALRLYDITTGTGDFIANGIVSHNCYARPTHEYLGFGTGVDFERRIAIKPRAPELLREAFEKKSWKGELVVFSGNTDCYQPLEASYELTRGCLQVCAEYQNPVHVITKSPLIERDIDLLVDLSRRASLGVSISVPFWDEKNARAIEPYVATPSRRMTTVKRLSSAGIRVSVNVAPIIPGLTDRDIGPILEAAAAAGAHSAAMILLRLPGSVKEVFEERMREKLPLAADRVLARTREVRGGRLNDPRFGSRMSGEGEYASAIQQLFDQTARRLGLNSGFGMRTEPRPTFRRPAPKKGQLKLF